MNTIKLNHWFINNNELAISLMHFYASINILDNDTFKVKVVNTMLDRKEMDFEFSTLENAIIFVEDTVAYSKTFEEVFYKYSMFCLEKEKTFKRKEKKYGKKD